MSNTELTTGAADTPCSIVPREVLEQGYRATLDWLVCADEDSTDTLAWCELAFLGAYHMLCQLVGESNPKVHYSHPDPKNSRLLTAIRKRRCATGL